MTEGIGKKFMQESRNAVQGTTLQKMGVPKPEYESPIPEGVRLIDLPKMESVKSPAADLYEVMQKRATLRKYQATPLSINELAALLWLTQGVKEVIPAQLTRRTVPSAGSRHPFETYVLVNRVDGLEPGLYRFVATRQAIYECGGVGSVDALTHACLDQEQIHQSAVSFFWAADAIRTVWRYGERGYRYIHLDAGHVCQNLYLAAEAIGCGVCAIAAFDDDLLNEALGLDGVDHFAVYAATLGKR